jgi:hypothetical protein
VDRAVTLVDHDSLTRKRPRPEDQLPEIPIPVALRPIAVVHGA